MLHTNFEVEAGLMYTIGYFLSSFNVFVIVKLSQRLCRSNRGDAGA